MVTKELVLAGMQLGAFVILLVQTLKFLGVTSEIWLKIGVLIGALVFGIAWGLTILMPTTAYAIELVTVIVVGVMTAVLGWAYAIKPIAQALKVPVTTTEITG